MVAYKKLSDAHKRVVNKLISCSHHGHLDDKTRRSINNILNRCNKDPKKTRTRKKMNGYVLFYKEEFKKHRSKQNEIGVTGIAKLVGKAWRELSQLQKQKQKYNSQVRDVLSDGL